MCCFISRSRGPRRRRTLVDSRRRGRRADPEQGRTHSGSSQWNKGSGHREGHSRAGLRSRCEDARQQYGCSGSGQSWKHWGARLLSRRSNTRCAQAKSAGRFRNDRIGCNGRLTQRKAPIWDHVSRRLSSWPRLRLAYPSRRLIQAFQKLLEDRMWLRTHGNRVSQNMAEEGENAVVLI